MLQRDGPGFASHSSVPASQKGCPYTQAASEPCTPSPGILKDLGYKPASAPQRQPQELAGESLPGGYPQLLPFTSW